MTGFKTDDPNAAAEQLRRRFRAVTRRIEWRNLWRGWFPWVGLSTAIAAGASSNDRTFGAAVEVGGAAMFAIAAGTNRTSITGGIADVATLDGTGLACDSLRSGSLSGHVALIQRGTCSFESKLTNAQRGLGSRCEVMCHLPSCGNEWRDRAGRCRGGSRLFGFSCRSPVRSNGPTSCLERFGVSVRNGGLA